VRWSHGSAPLARRRPAPCLPFLLFIRHFLLGRSDAATERASDTEGGTLRND
jgi:hypothetical protein